MEIKRAVDEEIEVVHPEEPELRGIYGTIISEPPRTAVGQGRNITIYAEGRSTGHRAAPARPPSSPVSMPTAASRAVSHTFMRA